MIRSLKVFLKVLVLVSFVFTTNCSINNSSLVDKTPEAEDPWENLNRGTFAFNLKFDKYLLSPLAKGYRFILPSEIRTGVRNFLSNLTEPWTTINSALQGDFKNTGYENVPIKDILQMSSGIIFNEDYGDYNSDINKFARALAQGTSMRDFAKDLKNGKEPGTFNHYVSIDTQMLAMLLEEVTGQTVAKNLQEKIWTKIGMEHDAYYMVDDTGAAWALGGLNATLRDYAKFGQLYLNNGKWGNQQIVPEEWVHASHKPDGPHLQPGENDMSSSPWGYGYQWWVPGFPSSDYLASGIYNQYIYIDPVTDVVIAKTSSNYKFNQERQYSKDAHVAMFRAIAAAVIHTP